MNSKLDDDKNLPTFIANQPHAATKEKDDKPESAFKRYPRLIFFCLIVAVTLWDRIYFNQTLGYLFSRSVGQAQIENVQIVSPEPGTIHWEACVPAVENVDCGSIVVPKDYFDPSAGTATIALARYKAIEHPRKGSVFINPGGPGGSGMRMALERGSSMAKLIGDDWDLIGFDPRGIGNTIPATQCFSSPLEYAAFFANTVIEQGITVSSISNLSSPALYDELVEQHRQFLALKEAQADLCRENMGDELRYMGTATVVRDIDFMSKIIEGEKEKINYWGGSYGSILGAYLVNMLPHRIGYAVIDGIADPVNWSTEPSHKWPINWISEAEKTYEVFLKDCSKAGPTRCPLTKYADEPWYHLERRFETFFDETARKPIPVPFGDRPGFLTSGAARGYLEIFLQRPLRWPEAAQVFSAAFDGNATQLYNLIVPPLPIHNPSRNVSWDLTRLAVTCLDSPRPASRAAYPSAEDLTDQGLKALREASLHFGLSTGISEPDGGCQFWPVDGPERFTGPWNATFDSGNKLLIVSNTADPITPKSSGLLINSLMPNSSVIIIQDGPGHCSPALPSLCTAKLQREYFAGITPKNGTVCTVDVATFPDDESMLRVAAMTAEDRELIEALSDIEEGIAQARSGY